MEKVLHYLEREYRHDDQDLQLAYGDEWSNLKESLINKKLDNPTTLEEEKQMKHEIDDFMFDKFHDNKKRRRAY